MVLIDVDGTLVDSVPDLAYCVDEMMKQLGRPAYGEEKVRNWVGNGVERLTRRALIGQLDGEAVNRPPDNLPAPALGNKGNQTKQSHRTCTGEYFDCVNSVYQITYVLEY